MPNVGNLAHGGGRAPLYITAASKHLGRKDAAAAQDVLFEYERRIWVRKVRIAASCADISARRMPLIALFSLQGRTTRSSETIETQRQIAQVTRDMPVNNAWETRQFTLKNDSIHALLSL